MVGKGVVRWLSAVVLSVALVVAGVAPGGAVGAPRGGGGDTPTLWSGAQPLTLSEEAESRLLALDLAFTSRRTAGDNQLNSDQAGANRSAAAAAADAIRKHGGPPSGPATFTAPWAGLGPNPIVQVTRSDSSFAAMSGRIGALAIRPSTHQFILGAAQGGIWLYDPATGTWTPETDNLASLSIGALAVAPSNDSIVYAGTGEGALSGDSYFGNGILKSTDGGATWAHVSGDYFMAVSISRLVVDPHNANHLFVSVLRGRGGARRVTPPDHSRFGIWESKNGGVSWQLLKLARSESNGATDVELDPQNTNILYASFWGDAIYKSTDGGKHWSKIMTGLPVGADYTAGPTRFSISLSHPAGQGAVLYAGFDWNVGTVHQPSRVFKSTNEGASWSMLPAGTGDDAVTDYCGGQCWYDNVIEADPTNPNVVYAAGQFAYDIGSGGIFRSDDGGQTWKNLGWNQHPDFHALAFDPSNTANVLIGSDGGVWFSADKGGRLQGAADEGDISAADWVDLNGTVDPNSAATLGRTNLQISQFTSVATVPSLVNRFWGGTQDNGTVRKSSGSTTWFDVASGDGGQVLVDPTDANYVYGTYFGISPYRYTDGGLSFFTNQYIQNGINLTDRSDFYIPMVMNQLDPNQLFLGTYRLYRTDNAKAASAGDVKWSAISPDLTSGCTGIAPNGARTCALSAIGVGGGQAVYTGSLDGYVYFSADAQVNPHPTWIRLGSSGQSGEGVGNGNDGSGRAKLPRRPVSQIAVDRSNFRTAYIAYAGFNGATPHRTGHVFKTGDAGATWKDVSGNLPDSPVNSIILDPSYPNTLYAGTDVGPFVTHNGGATWIALGTGFPIVSIWQLDMDPSHRVIAAGTHGRGAFKLTDSSPAVPALVLTKTDAGVPVGPGSNINYTLTVHNIGNADATGVKITDPIPSNTTFVSADNGGTYSHGKVTWSGLTVPKGTPGIGGSFSVNMTVRINPSLKSSVKSIINDGYKATAAEGPSTTGSPHITPIAPPYAVSLTPATQTDGARAGQSVTYTVTVKNLGYQTDSYTMSTSGGTYTVSLFDGATCAIPLATTPSVAPGGTTDVCVKVDVPIGATNGAVNTATVTATSVGSPTISASATVITIAVAVDTLLVDQDGNAPNVQSFYSAALTTAGVPFSTWDLATGANLPLHFMQSFKNIVWFTGTSYPGPITPYESRLKAFLDNGGRLFVSGQDILDQAAGTTAFVSDYLHVNWDGSEAQNDKGTVHVNGVAGNPVTTGIGAITLDKTVLGGTNFMDQVTPIAPATAAFTDDAAKADALSFSDPTAPYKVVFLAFAFEEYGTAGDRADLMHRVMTFFGP
jgi:uncharacterized repeat protein (TIGR01451 family)